jgi:hypothetical protein
MYCEHCGTKLEQGHKFCTKCGHSTIPVQTRTAAAQQPALGDKWWHRLLKVLYVVAYLPLLGIIPLVWSENTPYCSTYSSYCSGSYGEAFWYSLLTLVIYMAVLRLIKIAVLYVALGRKPEWKKEFKKLF